MKKLLLTILLLSLSSFSFADEDEDDFKFLRCVEASNNTQNTKYFEVSISKQIMIERNGYSFTYTRITPFLIQAELKGLAKLSLHRHLGTLAYSNLNTDGTVKDNQVYQCDSVPRLI